eukprot:3264301-Rhodomonas_salina.1
MRSTRPSPALPPHLSTTTRDPNFAVQFFCGSGPSLPWFSAGPPSPQPFPGQPTRVRSSVPGVHSAVWECA